METTGGTGTPRRLATILAADVAGYSRLMGMDEEGVLARLKRHRRELIEPSVAEHHGRIVKSTGDGFLAEFGSPVEAVRCAVVIQQSMVGRNAALPAERWIQFRIGVNLGDIIIDTDDDIYGDGVNIAARLEGLAVPGTVYISGGVYELVKNKLVVGYQPLGDQKVKNITDPVRVYRVLPDPAALKMSRARARWLPFAALALAALGGAAAVGLYLWQGSSIGEPSLVTLQRSPEERSAMPGPIAIPAVPEEQRSGSTAPKETARPPPAPQEAPAVEEQRRLAVVTPAPPPAPQPPAIREPEMISLPGGEFTMGSNEDGSERPVHRVSIAPFALGKYPVTVAEWKACEAAGGCAGIQAGDDERLPIANVSWTDAQQYVAWLAKVTNRPYRLPSEAEWEYAARGGTQTRYWWGNEIALGSANCRGCGEPYDPHRPLKVGSFLPNPFGLYDMAGGVAEWVADCWHKDYHGAPANGSPWEAPDCSSHVLRGGSWKNDPSYLRAASRDQYDAGVRYPTHGFRVARSP